MYADRYGSRPVDRGSLTLSVAIVGGLLGTAMLSNTIIHRDTDRHLPIYAVTPDPPPPKPEPKPEPQQRANPQTPPIVTPDPMVKTIEPQPELATTTIIPDAAPPLTPGTGDGVGAAPVDPPKPPPPSLRGAEIDGRYAQDFQPAYPLEERRAGREGVVSLRVLIGVDGRVREVERVAAASDAFWRVTEQRALAKWRFTPATRDGIPYEAWKTMTVRFRLELD